MHEEYDEEEDLGPSKSEIKRQMLALQKIGVELVGLSEKEFKKIPLSGDRLPEAIATARRITSNNAKKRQMQFIGRLMREVDVEPIIQALAALHQRKQQKDDSFHRLEELRDEVLSMDSAAIDAVLSDYPQADRQHLRQLARQHKREQELGKPPSASRKLFKYLRELQAPD